MQRRVVDAIAEHQEGREGLEVSGLKRRVGADRSNVRRAIRGLIERGMVAEVRGEDGERRVLLGEQTHLIAVLKRVMAEAEPWHDEIGELKERWAREDRERLTR